MVNGLDTFKRYFEEYQGHYVIIGGTACDRQFESKGLTFRATKDIDMILIVEALDDQFVQRFWEFIGDGEYNQMQVEQKDKKYYRFLKPQAQGFPAQIELFSRKPDVISEKPGMHLTPIPTGEDLSSLSAILIDETFYRFTLENSQIIDGLHVASDQALICLKSKAFLDMRARKEAGDEQVSSNDMNKHKNDVIRLTAAIPGDSIVACPEAIKQNVSDFVSVLEQEKPDIKSLVQNTRLEDIIEQLRYTFLNS